jgi:hypothetical protein
MSRKNRGKVENDLLQDYSVKKHANCYINPSQHKHGDLGKQTPIIVAIDYE